VPTTHREYFLRLYLAVQPTNNEIMHATSPSCHSPKRSTLINPTTSSSLITLSSICDEISSAPSWQPLSNLMLTSQTNSKDKYAFMGTQLLTTLEGIGFIAMNDMSLEFSYKPSPSSMQNFPAINVLGLHAVYLSFSYPSIVSISA
jgi:hypothetical protein